METVVALHVVLELIPWAVVAAAMVSILVVVMFQNWCGCGSATEGGIDVGCSKVVGFKMVVMV